MAGGLIGGDMSFRLCGRTEGEMTTNQKGTWTLGATMTAKKNFIIFPRKTDLENIIYSNSQITQAKQVPNEF